MPRKRRKPQAPKRPFLSIKRDVKKRKDYFFASERYKRERGFG